MNLLYLLLDFNKYYNSFFFIPKTWQLLNSITIFKYKIKNSLLKLQANIIKDFPGFLEIFIFNNVDIEIYNNSLFDNFKSNYIIFFLFLDLNSGSKLDLQVIYKILGFFFLSMI